MNFYLYYQLPKSLTYIFVTTIVSEIKKKQNIVNDVVKKNMGKFNLFLLNKKYQSQKTRYRNTIILGWHTFRAD